MTIDPIDTPIDDSQMFAPVPSWERGKKRRSFGRRVAAEPRSFAPAATTSDDTAPTTSSRVTASPIEPSVNRLDDVDPASSTFAAPPVYATRAPAKSSSAPVAIAAGLILIGGIAAAGWYYTQPHGQTGVAELTPGGSTTTTTTDTSAAPAAPSQMAQNTPPPIAKTATTTTRSSGGTVTTHTRAAPARSRTASDTAADASTTAPAQPAAPPMPLPTPGVAPLAAAAPAAPLVLNIPPAATAPQAVTPQAAPQTAPPPTQVPQA